MADGGKTWLTPAMMLSRNFFCGFARPIMVSALGRSLIRNSLFCLATCTTSPIMRSHFLQNSEHYPVSMRWVNRCHTL